MRVHLKAAIFGACLGIAASCGPVTTTGPTALIVKVLLNEGRGTRLFYVTGVDDTPVNVFPSVYRPESPSPTQLPTGESFRILLDDSVAGMPINLTVVGINDVGDPVESGTLRVVAVARQETPVTIKLNLYEQPDAGPTGGGTGTGGGGGGSGGGTGGGGSGPDGGAGGGGATPCDCMTSCCPDSSSSCAPSVAHIVIVGTAGQVCRGVCEPNKADRYSPDAGCQCGSGSICGEGLRCSEGRCVCDAQSGCKGCCSTSSSATASCVGFLKQSANACGSGGQSCQSCNNGSTCTLGVCSTCVKGSGECCSGNDKLEVKWPRCGGQTSAQCNACDITRSDRCEVNPLTGNSCTCGNNKLCAGNELCISGTCRTVTIVP